MKMTFLLSLILLTAVQSYSQQCKTIDGATMFKDIQFGRKIPQDLYTGCSKSPQATDMFTMRYDEFDAGCKNKYDGLFHDLSPAFTLINIELNKKMQVFKVRLWAQLDSIDWKDTTNGKLPEKYTSLYNKLVLQYGKPAIEEDVKSPDPFNAGYYGKTRQAEWECNGIRIDLKVTFASSADITNILTLYVKDTKYELVEQEVTE